MGRVLVFLLGVALAGMGWAIHDPGFLTTLSAAAPSTVPLGPLDAFRPLIAAASGILGLLLILGSVIGHRTSPQPKVTRLPPAPLVFDAHDPAPFAPAPLAAAAEEAPLPPADPPPEPAPFPGEIAAPAAAAPVEAESEPEPETTPFAATVEEPAPVEVAAIEPEAPEEEPPPLVAETEAAPQPAPDPEPPLPATSVAEVEPDSPLTAADADPFAIEPEPAAGAEPPLEPEPTKAVAASDPEPVAAAVEPEPAAQAEPPVEPEPTEVPVEPQPEAVAAGAEPEPLPQEGAPRPAAYGAFDLAREELRRLAREEDWRGVASVLASLRTLANSNSEHALAAQDLGVFHRSQGRREDAGEAFDHALGYARLVSPPDAALLAATLTDAGDCAMEEHRLEAAIDLYSELVETRRGLVAADPSPENRRLLSLALERLGDAREDRGHRTRALQLYQESLDIAGQLAAADPARYGAELTLTRDRVAELEARLA